MKVDKFMLVDSCDSNYADLITFNLSYELKDIEKTVQEVKDSKPGEYTNEDIITVIIENYYVESVIDLYHVEKVEY